MKISTPIHDFLCEYAKKKTVRCHMPGAKGRDYPLDITEIEGADSLFESSGVIAKSECNASMLFGSGSTLFSAGGSTLAIQTMLALVKAANPVKNRVIAGRYCHRSLVSACALLGLEIEWVLPEKYLSCAVSAASVEQKITPKTLAVFIQTIDYYGGESDVSALAKICRKHGLPLLADNAHGAYHVFTHLHPLKLGVTMCADSAHKTLPCITGGAYLHISTAAPEFFHRSAKAFMTMFASSSPSYLILDSLDLCNRHIAAEKSNAEQVFAEVKKLKTSLMTLGFKLQKSDLLRICIKATDSGISGFELGRLLRGNGVECELCDDNFVVLLFSTGQDLSDFPKILDAASKIKHAAPILQATRRFNLPTAVFSLHDAVFSPTEQISIDAAEGRICGAIVAPCPPGIPLVMPGELFSASAVAVLKLLGTQTVTALKN